MPNLRQAVEFSHDILNRHVTKGDSVVDATVGNGNDTVFLAELVGQQGKVWGFDIQPEAINATKINLSENGLANRVKLLEIGHEMMGEYIKTKVSTILFNLGYLPGGDKSIVTNPKTTLAAVKSGLKLLKLGGIMVLVIYLGHPTGQQESISLLEYLKELDYHKYNVLQYQFINQPSQPPQVLVIKKRG